MTTAEIKTVLASIPGDHDLVFHHSYRCQRISIDDIRRGCVAVVLAADAKGRRTRSPGSLVGAVCALTNFYPASEPLPALEEMIAQAWAMTTRGYARVRMDVELENEKRNSEINRWEAMEPPGKRIR